MTWTAITTTHPDDANDGRTILLCNAHGVLGIFSGYNNDEGEDHWFIDDAYYDGDDPPTHWLVVPPCPSGD